MPVPLGKARIAVQ